MTSDNKSREPSKKNKDIKEIEIEQQDLLNVFFDKSSSQFESQLFLSRKKMLNAENGQNELSELLKSKLKALDMMLLILTNNKNILKESNLSCCEVLNNLLSISKKDKLYGEHIYSKIKTIILYILKNQLSIKEKNSESNKKLIKFLLTLLNIKFDNGYFKQLLEIISPNQEMCTLFIDELFDKLFKGRNITIKIKEMKYIIKTLLFDDNIKKYMNFFDITEKILSFAHEKASGGCRTSFQLNQVVFLLQYLVDIVNVKEIKNALPEKEEINKRLVKILNDVNKSINGLVDKNDYEFDINKIHKKDLEAKNEIIKRKKIFFAEMHNFLNKLKKSFEKELNLKESSKVLGEINNLYKNIINAKYIVIINNNVDNKNDKSKKNKKDDKEKHPENKKEKNKNKPKDTEKEKNKEEESMEENEEKMDMEEDEDEEDKKNEDDKDEDYEFDEIKNKKKEIKLNEKEEEEEEVEEKEEMVKKNKKENKKIKKEKKENKEFKNKKTKRDESKNNKGIKKENKNKKKKEN